MVWSQAREGGFCLVVFDGDLSYLGFRRLGEAQDHRCGEFLALGYSCSMGGSLLGLRSFHGSWPGADQGKRLPFADGCDGPSSQDISEGHCVPTLLLRSRPKEGQELIDSFNVPGSFTILCV